MPYISKEERKALDERMENIDFVSVGHLNYIITKLCQQFLEKSDKRYSDYNDIIGVLECAKQEFYRRSVSVYEDKKIKENGDVY
jgi:hypothetical protein